MAKFFKGSGKEKRSSEKRAGSDKKSNVPSFNRFHKSPSTSGSGEDENGTRSKTSYSENRGRGAAKKTESFNKPGTEERSFSPAKRWKEKEHPDNNKDSENKKRSTHKNTDAPSFNRFHKSPRTSGFGEDENGTRSKTSYSENRGRGAAKKTESFNKSGAEERSFSPAKRWKEKEHPDNNRDSENKKRSTYKNTDAPSFNRYRNEQRPSDYNETRKRPASNSDRPFKKKFFKKNNTSHKPKTGPEDSSSTHTSTEDVGGLIRLNKYLSNAGICSRREADELIATGVIKVNGKIITEMGYKVKPTDVVNYGGQTLKKERPVYLILNKPKDYITTYDDPEERKTVMQLIQGACRERIYPVGRLDRNTTGLLLFTNDGELTKKLTHPRYGVRKIYHVELDKPLKHDHLEEIAQGIELEDGIIKADEVAFVGNGADKTQVGIEIHSGKNHVVRRIFEHFDYKVKKLDRVMFGPLTKKDMARGRWRFLTDAEVGMLKMIGEKG